MQIVTAHKNTDFDALASMVAATVLYQGSVAVLPRSVNPNVKAFLSIHKDVFKTYTVNEIDLAAVQRLIVVDVNRWNRLDGLDALKSHPDLDIVLWDHHETEGDIHAGWQCQESMGANITLMVQELKKQRKIFTPIQATLFLAGLYEDTGNLTFTSSRAEDAYAAAYLLENKADLNVLSTFLRPAYGVKQKNILFEMLKTTDHVQINGYKISLNQMEIEGHVNGLAVVVGMYREILNVDAAFGIFSIRDRDRCMVIGRSNIESLNIGAIMQSLGGGGHPGAGAALLKSVDPGEVATSIKKLIEVNQQSSVQISDLMSFPVFSIPSHATMREVAAILRTKGCTGVPVVDEGRMVGIISRRDFRKIKKDSQLKAPVKAYMRTPVVSIEPGKSPAQAARLMVKHDIGRLPVVDNGNLIGIVTRSDTMLYFYDLLPD